MCFTYALKIFYSKNDKWWHLPKWYQKYDMRVCSDWICIKDNILQGLIGVSINHNIYPLIQSIQMTLHKSTYVNDGKDIIKNCCWLDFK